jgi:uncharacterized membrane protein
VYLVIKLLGAIRSGQATPHSDRNDSINILKIRYARGEIGQEDYSKMREILEQ